MTTSRSASDKLIGYFYQFDRSIIELLRLENSSQQITVEGYEDIDNAEENIQVKYLTSQKIFGADCNMLANEHIEKPIILLFLTHISTGKKQRLLGHFDGTSSTVFSINKDKIRAVISGRRNLLNDDQKNLLDTHTEEHIDSFMKNFLIEVVQHDYDSQTNEVKRLIGSIFAISNEQDIDLYYNYALSIIIKITSKLSETERTISKQSFTDGINRKESLYARWFHEKVEKEKYIKAMKKGYFKYRTIPLNERIFIIEVIDSDRIEEIKISILDIWNHLTPSGRSRSIPRPYFYIIGISQEKLIELKELLHNEGYIIEDGYYFQGCSFKKEYLTRKLVDPTKILRLLSSQMDLEIIINEIGRTLNIYTFYRDVPLIINTHKIVNQIYMPNTTYISPIFQ